MTKPTPHAPPRACKPLGDRVKTKLRRLARGNSETFARAMIAAAEALETTARTSDNNANNSNNTNDNTDTNGLEFVDSFNGIDLYEDVTHARASHVAAVSTRLRSLCHMEADIHDVVRRLTTTATNAPHSNNLLPGVVETHELVSVLEQSDHTAERASADEFPEHIGVNWFLLDRETTRDSKSETQDNDDEHQTPAYEFIVLSYQGVFQHRGRRGWVQWCQSIDLSSFPERASTSKGPKRGVLFSSGIVAVESATKPGNVLACYSLGLDLSVYDGQDRRFLERAVWQRVMKLAALKKSMLRESLSRTLSMSSTEPERHSSEQASSPKVVLYQPEAEPRITMQGRSVVSTRVKKQQPTEYTTLAKKIQELRSESATVTTKKSSSSDKRRLRAQTMQPTPSSSSSPMRPHQRSLFRVPTDSLEFRLSLYNEPDAFPEDVPPSPIGQKHTTRDGKVAMSARVAAAFKPVSKGNRPKSRSMGNGWIL